MSGERIDHLEAHAGPWRRRGPLDRDVDAGDIRIFGKQEHVPVRTYGVREGEDRRQQQSADPSFTVRRPLSGIPVIIDNMVHFVGGVGDRMPWSAKSRKAGGAPRGPERYSGKNRRIKPR